MADLLQLLHEQPVSAAASLVVAHGLAREGLIVQLLDATGKPQPGWILSSQPTAADPLNSFDLVFSQVVTGRLQVFGSSAHSVQLPSAQQSVQIVESSAFGSERFYVENNSPDTHTSERLLTNLTLAPTVEGGTYRLEWYYEWAMNSTGYDFVGEVSVDGSEVAYHRQEPKDSSGYSLGGSWSGTDQSQPVSGFWEGTLSAGTHNILLKSATSKDDYQVTIYRSRMSLVRVA